MMEMNLEQLLELSEQTPEDKFYIVRKVGGDETKIPFHIRAIKPSVAERITKTCTRSGGKVDETEVTHMTIAESCIVPNFKDPALLEKMQVSSPAQAVKRILLSGEVEQVSQRILRVSGFSRGAIVDVEEVKNA